MAIYMCGLHFHNTTNSWLSENEWFTIAHGLLWCYHRRLGIEPWIFWMQDFGCNIEFSWLVVVVVVVVVVGCWLLVVGCWLLVVGCWLLVVGCWLLSSHFLLLSMKLWNFCFKQKWGGSNSCSTHLKDVSTSSPNMGPVGPYHLLMGLEPL